MSGVSTHVLDTARGQPARGIRVLLERASEDGSWGRAGAGLTDSNGRIATLLDATGTLQEGAYRLTFYVGDYFEGQEYFYPEISVQFMVQDPAAHYHVPLLLSPYGYTTYRGS
ncbi:MAG TPA: hydroxyisourate hydrolase [Bryobacteraceae bacterium]|nr:hydroxyisourate hydrolase [Bryobacteraceae bacterium]